VSHQSALLSFAQFVSPSQRCFFCAICVPHSALVYFAQFVSPSQTLYILRNLCLPVSAVRFCTICITQSAPSNRQFN
jgi:hypothetical protein